MGPDESQPGANVTPASLPAASRPPLAWQPFTPRGIAAFAHVAAGRLFAVQLIVAFAAALVALWFLSVNWFPMVRDAIEALPETGAIQDGQLRSPYAATEPLALNRFLAVVLDPQQRMTATAASDVILELRAREFRVGSLFGWYVSPYPAAWRVEFNRSGLLALWDAWRPHLLWMTAVFTLGGLMLLWTVLATVYAPIVKAAAFYRDRDANLAACWRLAGAALMPGALVMLGSIVLYGLGALELIKFLVLVALHFAMPWVFLFLPLKHLPPRAGALATGSNPFVPEPVETPATPPTSGGDESQTPSTNDQQQQAGPRRGNNPFSGPSAGK